MISNPNPNPHPNPNPNPNTHKEVTPFDHGKLFEVLRIASREYSGEEGKLYERSIPNLACATGSVVNYTSSVINLIWPKLA